MPTSLENGRRYSQFRRETGNGTWNWLSQAKIVKLLGSDLRARTQAVAGRVGAQCHPGEPHTGQGEEGGTFLVTLHSRRTVRGGPTSFPTK